MSYLDKVKTWLGATDESKSGPRIAMFGDSHTAALQRAQEFPNRADLYQHINIVRVRKSKGPKKVGDVNLEDFCRKISRFDENDFVFSVVGGNQYAVFSTIQSPTDFDFVSGPADDDIASDRAQLVPMRAIAGYIEGGIRGNDGPVLEAIRRATSARVIHLLPPPPKEDNAFISQYFETRFAGEGIDEFGPSKPRLRLKAWKVQADCLQQLCRELGVECLPPPANAVTKEGFLQPQCYAKDVTHANRRYGEMVLKQILEITALNGGDQG